MNKFLKMGTSLCVGLLCLVSLSSCGLSTEEKNAKAYMKEHAEDFSNFSFGLGLKYESDSVSYNFSTEKGSYTSKDVKFKFDCEYDWEEDDFDFTVTKITEGEDNKIGLGLAKTACQTELAVMFGAVALANEAYLAEQK